VEEKLIVILALQLPAYWDLVEHYFAPVITLGLKQGD
jgi:hypothetical protein